MWSEGMHFREAWIFKEKEDGLEAATESKENIHLPPVYVKEKTVNTPGKARFILTGGGKKRGHSQKRLKI